MARKLISFVIPAYNEEDNAPILYRELCAAMEPLAERYEIEFLFVDDGSADNTWLILEGLALEDARVSAVSFSRNFGHQYALEAGIALARGDAVISLDADLQHPPAAVPELIAKWEEGFEIVNTKRSNGHEQALLKRMTSYLFYRFMNLVSDVPVIRGSADFRLLDRAVVEALRGVGESERFYRGLVHWVGFPMTTIEYHEGKRTNGETTYTFRKMLSLAWTAITSFSTVPMKAIAFFGLLVSTASALLLVVMSIWRFGLESDYFSEMAFLVVFIIFSNGIILSAIGLVAMYLLRIFKEVQRKPNYIIRRSVNLDR